MRRLGNQDWISGTYLQLAPGADSQEAKDSALAILRARHHIAPGAKDDFAVLDAKDTIKLQNSRDTSKSNHVCYYFSSKLFSGCSDNW